MNLTFRKIKKRFSKDNHSHLNQNPYLDRTQGKRIWNERYLNLSKARREWQLVALGLFISQIISLCLIFKLSTASSVKPFVVELSKGMPIGIASTLEGVPHSEQLMQFAINEFITNARTILGDSEAQKHLLGKTC